MLDEMFISMFYLKSIGNIFLFNSYEYRPQLNVNLGEILQ